MAQSTRTFRLFVSSTFSDLKAERNALQEKVFPPLRELAAAHGCRFQAVDLRWGVSEEAALDQQTMNICLGEIQRCQKTSPRPNFIILLGNRYGWRPLPVEIPADEFELLLNCIPDAERDLILQWYRQDVNAISPVYLLQPRSGEFEGYEKWGQVEARLHAFLESAARQVRLAEADLAKYTASATEQEILHGAIQVVNAREHIFCFAREIDSIPNDDAGRDYIDLDSGKVDIQAASQLKELKSRLKGVLGDNYHEYTSQWQDGKPSQDHLDRLVEDVYRELEGVILREIQNLEQVDPVEKEIAAHQAFGEMRQRHFIGREQILKQIDGYLLSSNRFPLVIHGQPGSGKSALMAKAIRLSEQTFHEANIVTRFIGATPASSDGRILLLGLCQQVSRLYGGDETTLSQEYKDLVQEFPHRLALAQPDKPLILFLDALDQLANTNNSRSLGWLPRELPPNVRVVVSTLPGECLKNLESKLPLENRLELRPMPVAEGDAILDVWLKEAGRKLQPGQMERILAGFQECGLPLFLKLAFEEARHWKSYQTAPELSPDIQGMLRNLFKRLSADSNHGDLLVSHSLAYLAAAKNGLSEDELLDVLSMDKEVLTDFYRRSPKSPKVDRLPPVIWSRLYYDLEPYLAERSADGTSLLSFYHAQVREVIAQQLLQEKEKYHHLLVEYFNNQPLAYTLGGVEKPNLRKLSELPYQQLNAGEGMGLIKTVIGFRFMESKLAAFGPFSLMEDYKLTEMILDFIPDDILESVELIKESLQLSLSALIRDVNQLPAHLIGRLKGYKSPLIRNLLKQASAKDNSAWLCPQTRSLKSPGGLLLLTLAGHTSWVEEAVVSPDGKRAISTSMDDQRVWDLKSGMELNVQTERAHILYVSWQEGLVWTSDRNGKIKIRELDTGSVRFTLAEHYQRVNTLAFTPDKQRALTCSYDGTVKVWETTNWQLIVSLEGHSAGVTSLVITPDGKFAVSGGDEPDNSLVVWDLGVNRSLKTLTGHTGKIINCAFTHDGRRMISTSENEYIVWELPGFRKLFDHEGWLVTLSPDGMYILSQPDVRTIDVCHAENGGRVFCTEYTDKRMDLIKVTSDSRFIVIGMSAGVSARTYVLNISDGEEVTDFWGEFLALAPNDKTAIVAGDRFVLQMVGLQTGTVTKTFAGHTSRLTGAIFTDQGRKLISTCTDQTVKVWDVQREAENLEISGHAYWIMTISTHDKRALTGSQDGSFKLWNLDTGEVEFSNSYDPRGILDIRFTADGKRAAIVYSDDIQVWDMDKLKEVFMVSPGSVMNMGIRAFRMSPDGRRAISHVDCTLYTELVAWDLEAGTELFRFKLEMGQSGEIALSPDGMWAAVGAYPSLLLWNLESGTSHKLEGHDRSVTAITFSPDSRLLATASEDSSIKVYNIQNPGLLGTLSGHTKKVNDILFKDNETLFSSSVDGTIMSWDVPGLKSIFSFASRDEPKNLSFNALKNWLLSRSRDSVCLWDLNTGQELGSFIDDSELFAMDAADVVLCGGKSGGFHILKVIPPKIKEVAPAPVQVEEKPKQSPVPVVEEAKLPAPDPAELEKQGKSCLDTGRYGQALQYFDDALTLKPNDTNLLFYRATTLTRSGKYEEGIVQLDYIIDNNLAPGLNLGYAYLGKANLLVSLKRYEESLEWYQKAIKIVNNVRVFWYMQGYALYCLSKFDEALPSLQKAEQMSSDETTREFIGWCQLGVKKFEEAWDTFSKLTARPPRDILSWYGMGLACKALGKKEQAREALKKFLESTQPEHAPHLPRAKQILQELNV